jgi:hypothetical protein
MIVPQPLVACYAATSVDRHHFHLLLEKMLHGVGVGLNARSVPRRTGGLTQASPNGIVVGHRRPWLQETLLLRQVMVPVDGDPGDPQVPRDAALTLAGAQAVDQIA